MEDSTIRPKNVQPSNIMSQEQSIRMQKMYDQEFSPTHIPEASSEETTKIPKETPVVKGEQGKKLNAPPWSEKFSSTLSSLGSGLKVFGLGMGVTLCGWVALATFPVSIPLGLIGAVLYIDNIRKNNSLQTFGSTLAAPWVGIVVGCLEIRKEFHAS